MDSAAMRATAADSFSDSIATLVVLIAAITEKLTDKQLAEKIEESVKAELGETYFCVIHVDKGYAGEQA